RNLGFLFINPRFGCLTALLYTLTCWSVLAPVHQGHNVLGALGIAIDKSVKSPTAVFWILLVWGGFLLFTDTYSKWYRAIAGTLHGLAHVLATFFMGWSATYLSVKALPPFASPLQLLLAAVIIAALGWVVGSTVMGIYLTISLNFFARHGNEAFSALAIPGLKKFLKLKLEND